MTHTLSHLFVKKIWTMYTVFTYVLKKQENLKIGNALIDKSHKWRENSLP
jgi:hypothetical protein